MEVRIRRQCVSEEEEGRRDKQGAQEVSVFRFVFKWERQPWTASVRI